MAADGNFSRERAAYIRLRVQQLENEYKSAVQRKKEQGNQIKVIEKTLVKPNKKKSFEINDINLSGLSALQIELVNKLANELTRCGSSLHGSKNRWRINIGTVSET